MDASQVISLILWGYLPLFIMWGHTVAIDIDTSTHLWPGDAKMALWIWVNIGSGNGLLLDSIKQLPEPMVTNKLLNLRNKLQWVFRQNKKQNSKKYVNSLAWYSHSLVCGKSKLWAT